MAASTGGIGTRTTPRALRARVIEWAMREACDRDQDSAARPGDEQKADQEQKMVVALEDVLGRRASR